MKHKILKAAALVLCVAAVAIGVIFGTQKGHNSSSNNQTTSMSAGSVSFVGPDRKTSLEKAIDAEHKAGTAGTATGVTGDGSSSTPGKGPCGKCPSQSAFPLSVHDASPMYLSPMLHLILVRWWHDVWHYVDLQSF